MTSRIQSTTLKHKLPILFLMGALVSLPLKASAKTDIMYILDASGSMRAAMEGRTQMDVAKQSIKASIESIPPETQVALRVYAHRVEQTDKAASCVDTELLIPFSPLNKADFSAKVDALQPKGYTPIAYSLQQTELDFGVEREAEKVLILVSDGEETCGGDPVQVVKNLIAKGFKLKVNAVGFNVDAKAQEQLKAIAAAGNGQYFDARDSNSLSSALKDITQRALLVDKPLAVYGSEIQGGSSYETAVPLPVNQELRLNHYQRIGQYDYFYVDLNAGQSLLFTMSTGQFGVDLREGANTVTTNTNPYAGFQLHDANRQRIGGKEIIGAANAKESAQIDAVQAGRYYVLVGSTYEVQNKDHPFKAELKSFFDAGSTVDAGNLQESALAIEKKTYPENYFMGKDDVDFYKINTTPGEIVTVKIVPENPQVVLSASFYDDLKVEISKSNAPNAGAGFRISGKSNGSTIYLKVARYYSDVSTKYSLEFEAAAPSITTPTTPAPVPALPTTPSSPTITGSVPTPAPVKPLEPAPSSTTVTSTVKKDGSTQIIWLSSEALKVLGSVFGIGSLVGLILGVWIRGMFIKKPKVVVITETDAGGGPQPSV